MNALSPQLVGTLLQVLVQAPELETEIKDVFAAHGVTPELEAEARAVLAKDPNAYFQGVVTPSTGNAP